MTSPESPESLFAEHKEAAKRVMDAEGSKDHNLAHLAYIDANPSNPYSDRLDRNDLKEDLSEANFKLSDARAAYDKNIEESKAHLKAHPEEYN